MTIDPDGIYPIELTTEREDQPEPQEYHDPAWDYMFRDPNSYWYE